MKMRWLLDGILVAALAAMLLGCQGKDKDRDKDGGDMPKSYGSPNEVFDALTTAAEKNDSKTFIYCLTEDTRDVLVFGFALALGKQLQVWRNRGGPEAREAFKPLEDVLKKHDITDEVVANLDKGAQAIESAEPKEMIKGIKKLAGAIKDRPGFFVDYMDAVKKAGGRNANPFKLRNAKLKDLQIDGNSARGVMVRHDSGQIGETPLMFKKERDSWRIELGLEEFIAKRKAAQKPVLTEPNP